MYGEKVIIIANETSQGISVIDIRFYNSSGRVSGPSPYRLIHDINALSLRDRGKIQLLVARSYGLPAKYVFFQ